MNSVPCLFSLSGHKTIQLSSEQYNFFVKRDHCQIITFHILVTFIKIEISKIKRTIIDNVPNFMFNCTIEYKLYRPIHFNIKAYYIMFVLLNTNL